jgi:transcriptional regulator with XRE-family HTH domain
MLHMSYMALRRQLREARRARGLSQEALAAAGRTSRVTIARLESGNTGDARLGTLERVCGVLGLDLSAAPRGAQAAAETRLAREQERVRRLERRVAHAALAARLLADQRAARPLIEQARAVVDRWEREHLCSRHYIERWRRRLSGSVDRVAGALVRNDDWQDALFQNTPWSFALEKRG